MLTYQVDVLPSKSQIMDALNYCKSTIILYRNFGDKNFGEFGKLQAICQSFFVNFIIELCVASHYPWQNIWSLVYGSIFPSNISTLSLQYCSYYRMYCYNELTVTSNLCYDSTFL